MKSLCNRPNYHDMYELCQLYCHKSYILYFIFLDISLILVLIFLLSTYLARRHLIPIISLSGFSLNLLHIFIPLLSTFSPAFPIFPPHPPPPRSTCLGLISPNSFSTHPLSLPSLNPTRLLPFPTICTPPPVFTPVILLAV